VPDPDALSVLTAATRYLFDNLLLVRGTDLSAPTPCREWDLRRLLRHVGASLADAADVLAAGERPERSGREPGAPAAGSDPVAALRAGVVDFLLAAQVHEVTAAPPGRWCRINGRPLPADVVVYVGALEMALHAWDIAQACRTDRPIPTELASALLCVSPPLAAAGLAGRVFAEPLSAPSTATLSEQLVALFGRQPLVR
jgi:uncharacterized protein (TIGR03086 family)